MATQNPIPVDNNSHPKYATELQGEAILQAIADKFSLVKSAYE